MEQNKQTNILFFDSNTALLIYTDIQLIFVQMNVPAKALRIAPSMALPFP